MGSICSVFKTYKVSESYYSRGFVFYFFKSNPNARVLSDCISNKFRIYMGNWYIINKATVILIEHNNSTFRCILLRK
jgi:hypothetical protein